MKQGEQGSTIAPLRAAGVLTAVLGTAFFVGSVQSQISVEHESIPARLEALYNNSRLHFELKSKHYDHALSAMMLAEDIDMIEETTGMTPLGLAAKDESADAIDVVKPLVLKYGADLKLADDKGFTPLHYAVIAGNYAVVEFLANHGADVEAVNILNERPVTPLYLAYQHDRPRIAEFLKMRGADDLDREARDDLELTASISNAAKQIAKDLTRDIVSGRSIRNRHQELAKQRFLTLAEAMRSTLEAQGKIAEIQELLEYRDRYLKAIENTPPEPGMTHVEYGDAVKKTMTQPTKKGR